MTFNPDAATVYADGPSTEPYEPSKPQIRTLLTQYETVMNAFTTNGGLIFATKALMVAQAAAYSEPRSAWVYADSTPANNGIYVLNPTTDTWTKVGRLPYDFVIGTDLGAGTANAIQITTDIPVADGMIVAFSLFEATTTSPVTVSINGGAALTLKTNRGSEASALTAGMEIWGRYRASDSTFRMLNDQDVSALVAQAEAARDEAVAARDDLLETIGVENYSNPTAPANVVIYIKSTGTDTITGPEHGTTEATAFLTWEAAVNHAKTYYRFIGRLSTVEFRFGSGSWGAISFSSTLYQGDEFYPFAVRITSIDDANRAEFIGITAGSWLPVCVHVRQVKAGYFSVVRRNVMSVDDVSVINTGTIPYCFRFGTGAQLFVFGDINVEEAVSFSSAFIYGTDKAFCSLENGDTPSIFPAFNLIGAGNITSPYKYRIVLGASIYCPANPYPMLTYASTYWVDAYSMSTQTQQGNDLENSAVGGPVVKRAGDTSAGYRIYADRYCEQWGTFSLTGLAAGKTVSAATVTFDVAFVSATYQIEFDSNNIGLRVGRNGSATTTTCPVGAWNHEASAQSATVRWRAYGYIA